MKKFECNECTKNCIIYRAEGGTPTYCVDCDNWVDWREVKEETVTNCDQLPKLTAEVFDRPDCPRWATYATVDKDGRGFYYHNKPQKNDYNWGLSDVAGCKLIGDFDPSDWENSLVERPAKALPDWCTVGKYVYDASLREYLYVKEEDYDWYVDPVARGRIKQARKRKFNEKEMKALVGKVFTTANGDVSIATDFDNYLKSLYIYNECFNSKQLADSVWLLDGKPCCILEHLNEKGEWVK